jgi:D-sedoheptulose 7-phosphate isomerase
MKNFFKNYFNEIFQKLNTVDDELIIKLSKLIIKTNSNKNKIILLGNGASASIASHASIDFTKTLNIRAINFNEANLITCFSNDFNYENWMSRAIDYYADKGDMVILISSSGKSKNIVNAGKFSRQKKLTTVTLSGFSKNNPLRKIGDLNFWINSNQYNIVETTHQTILLSLIDYMLTLKKKKI